MLQEVFPCLTHVAYNLFYFFLSNEVPVFVCVPQLELNPEPSAYRADALPTIGTAENSVPTMP